MYKTLLVILDGLGDEYVKELNGTPLEYVKNEINNFNKLASEGITGMMYPIEPGVPPSSDTAHLTIFGYDMKKEYSGRGVFEALGAGLNLEEGQVALRANFGTVVERDRQLIVVDRRAGRISGRDADILARDLQKHLEEKGLPVKFIHTLEHRGVLVIKPEEGELSSKITDVDPHEVNTPIYASQPFENIGEEEKIKAIKTAEILNRVVKESYLFLKDHPVNAEREKRGELPANVVLTRGAGLITRYEPFKDRWGYKAAFVAAGPLYRGIAMALGMEPINVIGATGTPSTNLENKFKGVLEAFRRGYDFVFLHIKGTDNLSHSKKAREKAMFIKEIDKHLSILFEILDDTVIAITGDHTTSSVKGKHMGLPVPILIHAPGGRFDDNKFFDETDCINHGGLGFIHGRNIMPVLLDLSDRANELGIRTSPKPVFYIGAGGTPLKL
ncbi:MAG: 2,3-bisphosphoglycerate-independent phosphoglycerate mutase [Candidatus Njordarchaeia archaeon]